MNGPAMNTDRSESESARTKQLCLYAALTDGFFASPEDYWLKSKSAKSHRVLVALSLAPGVSEDRREKWEPIAINGRSRKQQ